MGVDKKHPLYEQYHDTWIKCMDAYEGQEAIKAKGHVYLPRLSGHIADYEHNVTESREVEDGWHQKQNMPCI